MTVIFLTASIDALVRIVITAAAYSDIYAAIMLSRSMIGQSVEP